MSRVESEGSQAAPLPTLAELDVEILAQALQAPVQLHRPGAKRLGDSVAQAMARYVLGGEAALFIAAAVVLLGLAQEELLAGVYPQPQEEINRQCAGGLGLACRCGGAEVGLWPRNDQTATARHLLLRLSLGGRIPLA